MESVQILRVALSLLAVIGMLLAGAWLLRRSSGMRRPARQRITVLDARPLGTPRTHIAIVRVDQTTLVLGITPQQVTLLHNAPSSPEDCEPSRDTSRFADTLAQTLNRFRP